MAVLCILSFLNFSTVGGADQLTPLSRTIPPTFFGMHIHNSVYPSRNGLVTPWPNVSVPTWRLWDSQVRWPDIEPTRGQWRFDLLDKYLALAEAHHTEVLLPLAVTPQWASSQPDVKNGWQAAGLTAAPTNIDDWRTFVKQVATHCKGRVHAYEIWNEPNLKQYWIGNTEELVALTREAHDVIKAIDPTAVIVSPSATTNGGISWLAEFLHKGGSQYVDVVGYHLYVFPQPPEAIVGLIQRVKQTMLSNGAGDKPLWCTEVGWVEPKPFPAEDLAAAYLARVYILSWAAGVDRLYWYAWDNHEGVSLQTTAPDSRTQKPAGLAYAIIQQWLSGARMDWCERTGDDTWSCKLDRNGAPQWIVWNSSREIAFRVPPLWHVIGATELLGQFRAASGSSVDISPMPQLLTGSLQARNVMSNRRSMTAGNLKYRPQPFAKA
jgi:hypothetical protein